MNQTGLDLGNDICVAGLQPQQDALSARPAQCTEAANSMDRTGFDIGWDHAQHGLVPPAELLLDGTPLGQGWRAGKAVFGRRALATGRATRQWLALRTAAWGGGIAFDGHAVTAQYLAQIHTGHCPILRTALGGAAGQPDAAVVERLNPDAGCVAGNLAVMSHAAARARDRVDVLEALRRAHRIQAGADAIAGLDAAAWLRAAALRAYATPMPFHEAARLPMVVLPPRQVRLLNPVHGLQALITLQFATPGWAARTRAIAELLPAHTLRQDYNLLIGALAPRVLEAGKDPADLPRALEDAWLNERVQRRWQHLVLSVGAGATAAILERATALAAAHSRSNVAGQAVDARRSMNGRAAKAVKPQGATPWRLRGGVAVAQAGVC